MAIGTDDAIDKFGSTTEVMNIAGSAVLDGNMSDSGDTTTWTNSDDTREAVVILDATFSAAPGTNTTLDLFVRVLDISDGTQDQNEPDANYEHYYVGTFPLDSGSTTNVVLIEIDLPNFKTSTQYDFYLKNNSGASLNTGSTVDIIPKTEGPHP